MMFGTSRVDSAPRAPVMVSEAMRSVTASARDVADTDTTVLLLGESGTGKEVVARFIHEHSPRAAGPWVSLSCAAMPLDLLERELFGAETSGPAEGVSVVRGCFERARGGTLLLDEISELPPVLQSKLLRALETKSVLRVGGLSAVHVDVRLVSTCSRDLRSAVAAGAFRADLYYRLCVFPIVIPPLRERREDIEPLAHHFVNRVAGELGRPAPVLSAAALATLDAHHFEGNVRELRNLIERALIRCRQTVVEATDLFFDPRMEPFTPGPAGANEANWELPVDLAELERLAIKEALRRVGGNRTHAARLLGISLRTLRNKLRAWRESGVPVYAMLAEDSGALCQDRDAPVARSSQSKAGERAA